VRAARRQPAADRAGAGRRDRASRRAFHAHRHAGQNTRAAAALRRFYADAQKPLSVDDIQLGLVELATASTTRAPQPSREDAAGMPLLRTRRADLHGRTPNQIAYLKEIQAHDIAFGIGPPAPARRTSPSPAPSTRWSAMPSSASCSCARRRSGRAAGLPAGRPRAEGRPYCARSTTRSTT
jgi:hypothetical protein